MDRSSGVHFFIQPMNYKPSHRIILGEATNPATSTSFESIYHGKSSVVVAAVLLSQLIEVAGWFAFAQHDSGICNMGINRPLPAVKK